MIDHITKIIWTQPDGKMGYCFHVYYIGKMERNGKWRQKGRHYTYSFNDNLPNSVVDFILNASSCETIYTEKNRIEHYK